MCRKCGLRPPAGKHTWCRDCQREARATKDSTKGATKTKTADQKSLVSNELQMLREEVSRLKSELAESRRSALPPLAPRLEAATQTFRAGREHMPKANSEGKGLAYRAPCGANCRVFHEHVLG